MGDATAHFREEQLDPECVPLVRALNTLGGIRTWESCCGHGRGPFWVILSAKTKAHLLPLLHFIERPMHYQKWTLTVETGPDGAGVFFRLTTALQNRKGELAYQAANELAQDIEEGL